MSNLLDKWNDHIIKGNQLSRELENIESIIEAAQEAEIAFYEPGVCTTSFIRVLTPEKMQELKDSVVSAINQTRDDKVKELEKLMGIRKPATINPEFEAAVQGMVQSKDKPVVVVPAMDEAELPPVSKTPERLPGKKILGKGSELDNAVFSVEDKPVPKTLTDDDLEDVRRMYLDDGKTMKDIANHYGVTKNQINAYIQRYGLFRKNCKKDDGFLDAKIEARQKQPAETECL